MAAILLSIGALTVWALGTIFAERLEPTVVLVAEQVWEQLGWYEAVPPPPEDDA